MLSRVHLPILRQAITELAADSEKDDQEKYGQKLGMGNILTRTIKSMKGMYAEAMEDEKAAELDRFHDAYKFRAHELYASARYRAIHQSITKACRPSSLPDDAHLQKLKSFIAAEIARITTGRRMKVEEYVLLRSLVVSRLTLLNRRRGEEPARMLLSESDDAKNGAWLRRHDEWEATTPVQAKVWSKKAGRSNRDSIIHGRLWRHPHPSGEAESPSAGERGSAKLKLKWRSMSFCGPWSSPGWHCSTGG